MTRFTRVKSTHQRVEADSTSWAELKDTPTKEETQKNRKSINSDKPTQNKDKMKGGSRGSGGGNKNFKKNNNRDQSSSSNRNHRNRGEEEESANFTPIGGNPNVKGHGQTKQVKVFGNFWVGSDDARRLQDMAKKLKKEKIPRKQILLALQGERRKAEKAAKRRRDKTCFNCRQFGHVLFDCPNNKNQLATNGEETAGGGSDGDICFKCGSTEHTSRFCKRKSDKFQFAKCFVCSESGHIARQCPKNTKGIYPAGGSCDECGSVFHLKKDCPDVMGHGDDNGENDPTAQVARLSNPLLSTEYEEIPEEPSEADPSVIENVMMYKNNKSNKRNKRKPTTSVPEKTLEQEKTEEPEPERKKPILAQPAKRRRVKF